MHILHTKMQAKPAFPENSRDAHAAIRRRDETRPERERETGGEATHGSFQRPLGASQAGRKYRATSPSLFQSHRKNGVFQKRELSRIQ